MYKIEIMDECGSTIDEYGRTDLAEVRELVIELIMTSKALPDQIKVYREVKISCNVTVEFTC